MLARRQLARLLVSLASMLAARPTEAQRPVRLGVVINLRVNVSNQQGSRIATQVGDALRRQLGLDVIAGEEVERRLPPAGIPEDCMVRAACVRDLGGRLDAEQLLFLVIVRVGTQTQIDSTWADVASGRALPRDAITLEDRGPAANEVFARAAARLVPTQPTPSPAASRRQNSNPSPPATNDPMIPFESEGSRVTAPFLVSGLATLAALGGGLLLALKSRGDYNLVQSGCPPRTSCSQEILDRFSSESRYADALFGASAVAAVAALAFYLRGDGPVETTAALPVVSRSGGGLVLGGSF